MTNIIIPPVIKELSTLQNTFFLQNVNVTKPQPTNFNIPDSQNPPDTGVGYKSALGTVVLVDLTFHGQTYKNELGKVYTFPDITLEAVLLTVQQQKNIVKTSIQGRKGTVKEYISMGDYMLTINCIITGGNGSYPRSDVQDMITMLECPNPITVTSWYLNMFLINDIVIDQYDIVQDEGQYSRQTISIAAMSDEQVNLSFRA